MIGRKPLFEAKLQRYKAVAVFKNGTEGHIVFGQHVQSVQDQYDEAFFSLYGKDSESDQTANVQEIQIQRWDGQPDAGRWVHVKTYPVPQPVSLPIAIRREPSKTDNSLIA